ncbi:YdiU family protein [Vibrio sp. FNV 38]|nr:YdiU family protein [Vibrio sp. FNV 38]
MILTKALTHRYLDLPNTFYTLVKPQPLANTRWVAWNGQLASELGLPSTAPQGELKQFLMGEMIDSAHPSLAMKYAGHQFGVYNPDLGDGRGLLLGELANQSGIAFDLHLKGAGLTPYSRMGDGRAVLRSTIREYLGSEALAGLGIATTRALGMCASDTVVYREKSEYGALLLRVAESHIRFGHFEHLFYTGQHAELKMLADKVIEWHWPECLESKTPYVELLKHVIEKTVEMIAWWQAQGFTHGVMNTDNMSILGQTFDYGPYGFLDGYQAGFIPNHSDYQGRYAFDRQPSIAFWNLSALGYALSPLIEQSDIETQLERYQPLLSARFSQLMRQKLGLLTSIEGDGVLFDDMFTLLSQHNTDYPRFMRQLSHLDTQDKQCVIDLFVDQTSASDWLNRYIERCEREVMPKGTPVTAQQRCTKMRQINPKYVLRNYLAQVAIDKAEQGDYSEVTRLVKLLKSPFEEQPEMEKYAQLPPDWAKDIEISCSS